MRYYLLLFSLVVCVGCAENVDKFFKDGGTGDKIQNVSAAAGSAGVPLGTPIALGLGLIGSLWRGARGISREKKKKEATYDAIPKIQNAINDITSNIKDGLTIDDINKIKASLGSVVKEVTVATHSAHNVYSEVKKDLKKLTDKGVVKKLQSSKG